MTGEVSHFVSDGMLAFSQPMNHSKHFCNNTVSPALWKDMMLVVVVAGISSVCCICTVIYEQDGRKWGAISPGRFLRLRLAVKLCIASLSFYVATLQHDSILQTWISIMTLAGNRKFSDASQSHCPIHSCWIDLRWGFHPEFSGYYRSFDHRRNSCW
jgi:hypothetical protein